jgi:ssDNA-binding Zn-finger/Zn-ribbon topoisomerase 1
MKCPYCHTEMVQTGYDSQYIYVKCKNQHCSWRLTNAIPKDKPDYEGPFCHKGVK